MGSLKPEPLQTRQPLDSPAGQAMQVKTVRSRILANPGYFSPLVSCGNTLTLNSHFRSVLPARAVIIHHHSLGDLNNRNYFSHRSEGWKSKIKASAGVFVFFLEVSSWLADGYIVMSSHGLSFVYWHLWCLSICAHLFLKSHQLDWIRTHSNGLI